MSDTCPGPCNRGYRKAWAEHERAHEVYLADLELYYNVQIPRKPEPPEKPDLIPIPGEPVWCPRCAAQLRASLAELEDLAAIVAAGIDGHRSASMNEPVTGSSQPGSPDPRVDLMDELLSWLEHVEDDLRKLRKYPARPRRGRYEPRLSQCVHWLLLHFPEWVTHRGSIEVGHRIAGWRNRLAAAAKATPQARRKAARCPRCERRTLVQDGDRRYIRCEADDCGRLMKPSEYDDLVDALANRQETP